MKGNTNRTIPTWYHVVIALFFILQLLIVTVHGKRITRIKIGKKYEKHQAVHIIVNKIGPYNNPTETYRYYSLPFCMKHGDGSTDDIISPGGDTTTDLDSSSNSISNLLSSPEFMDGAIRHRQRLGQSLVGDARETSPYIITFLDKIDWRLLCTISYGPEELKKFKTVIENLYFFEMFIEDIPMWGYIGDVVEDAVLGEIVNNDSVYLYPHLHFAIGYNSENQIVSVQISTDLSKKVDITDVNQHIDVKYSYSVEWFLEKLDWKDRHSRYTDSRFLPASFEIHWLSIINSFVLVLLLTAFLTIIMLRVLKNDFSRYMELDDEALEEEESGWKLIHGDVFRFPNNPRLFCAAVGTGNHLLSLTFCHLTLALTGIISTNRRGSIMAGVVVLYCLTSFVGGYTAVRLYRQMNGKDWTRCILLTAGLFPFPVVCVFMWVNSVAMYHGSTSALPITTILTLTALFFVICLPLTVIGGSMAKNFSNDDFNAPTRTTKVAREIPTDVPWYRGRILQVLIAGFLPFSAIYIELHYIFASIWGHHIYTLFGILFLAFVLLVVVTSFITVALVYFQLAREDHRWWWAAYVNGGMTGLFIYVYSFYYYFHRSTMYGMLQGSFYFGYMAVVSFAFFLMLGSAAFQSSLVFVKYIYSRIKSD